MGKSNSEVTKQITLAEREWNRIVNRGVGRSFCKTVTETITNSDTSYKRKLDLDMSTGIIDEILNLQQGHSLNSNDIKLKFKNPNMTRTIILDISVTKLSTKIGERQCRIIDNAEGLSDEVINELSNYAGDKTAVSKGKPGRSLFGRGLSDVLLYHDSCTIYSVYKDNIKTISGFKPDTKNNGQPIYKVKNIGAATKSLRAKYNLPPEGNGTCIEFTILSECPIPARERMRPLLSNFYMLRLINLDPNTQIKVVRYEGSKKKDVFILDYDFPLGQVVGKFNIGMKYEFNKNSYPLQIDGIVLRSESDLQGTDGENDSRENGLIFVDENDAVLDQTFLPDYEKAPYLKNIYGIIKVKGLRKLLFDHLEAKPEAIDILTVSRDGFDSKLEFTKKLFKIIEKELRPIYEKEKKLYNKGGTDKFSHEVQNRINDALKSLNKFYKNEVEDDTTVDLAGVKENFQFFPEQTYLRIKKKKIVTLLIKKDYAKEDEVIFLESDNPEIEVSPEIIQIDKSKIDRDEYFEYKVSLYSEYLHAKGMINAITPSAKGKKDLTATLEINDVKSDVTFNPPEFMEFRPSSTFAHPNRKSSAYLYVNLNTIPLGRVIKVSELPKKKGNISMLDSDGEQTKTLKIVLDQSNKIEDLDVARIPIPFIGTGKGFHVDILAKTKSSEGLEISAKGKLSINEEKDDDKGIFKNVRYGVSDLKNSGMVVGGEIYINSNHPINKKVFGVNQSDFDNSQKESVLAQQRFAEVLLDITVTHTLGKKDEAGELKVTAENRVQDIQREFDKLKWDWSQKIYKAIVTNIE